MCQGIGGTNNNDSMERIVSRLFANFIPLCASFSSSRDFFTCSRCFRKMTKLQKNLEDSNFYKEKGKEVEEILVEFCKICFTNTLIQYSLNFFYISLIYKNCISFRWKIVHVYSDFITRKSILFEIKFRKNVVVSRRFLNIMKKS